MVVMNAAEMDTNAIVSPPLAPAMLDELWQHPPLKLGVLASGSGSNFEAIAQAIADRQLNAEIVALVYNNPKATVVERAERLQVPAVLHNHRGFDSREALDQAIIDTLRSYGADWVVMAGWMRRVTQVLIDGFGDRILNIHPSLLPSFPGIHGIEQALDAGVAIAGCTVHRVELKVDSGPILMQAAVPILPGDTADTLHRRVQVQEHRIYPAAIALAAWQNLQQPSQEA